MNMKNDTKYFNAVAYDGNIYNFEVTPEGNIYCTNFNLKTPANVIELKPNFVLRDIHFRSFYSLDEYTRDKKIKKSLISEWNIEEDVFQYLISGRQIMYSSQMAILYGFDQRYAFDAPSQQRAFKYSRNNRAKRQRILAPMKSGKFN